MLFFGLIFGVVCCGRVYIAFLYVLITAYDFHIELLMHYHDGLLLLLLLLKTIAPLRMWYLLSLRFFLILNQLRRPLLPFPRDSSPLRLWLLLLFHRCSIFFTADLLL